MDETFVWMNIYHEKWLVYLVLNSKKKETMSLRIIHKYLLRTHKEVKFKEKIISTMSLSLNLFKVLYSNQIGFSK